MRRQCPLVRNDETRSFYAVTHDAAVVLLSSSLLRARGALEVTGLSPPDSDVIIAAERFFAQWMVFDDSLSHAVLRRALRPALSPRESAALVQRLHSSVWSTLSEASGDPLTTIAGPLARRALQEVLGVSVDEAACLTRVSQALIGYLATAEFELAAAHGALTAIGELEQFVIDALPKRQGIIMPTLANLVELEQISMRSAVATVAQILTGVIEPTATLVAGMLDRMRRSPNIITLLGEGVVTIKDVVEETLRFDAPFHFALRTAAHRFTFHDVVVPENSRVVVVLASANRDELAWEHPDVFDPGRRHLRHLTFGVGRHSCLGAGVARYLARSVLDAALHLDVLPRLSPLQRVPAVGGTRFEAERR